MTNTQEREELPEPTVEYLQIELDGWRMQYEQATAYQIVHNGRLLYCSEGMLDAYSDMKNAYGRLCRAGREDVVFDPVERQEMLDALARQRRSLCAESDELQAKLDKCVARAKPIIEAALAVVSFDWSDNDDDAVAAIEALRRRLSPQAGG